MATEKNHEDNKAHSPKNGMINLNAASLEDLENAKIPNLSTSRLRAIIAERDNHGPFTSFEDIHKRVASIGDRFTHGIENFCTL